MNPQTVADRIAELSSALYQKGLYTECIADGDPSIGESCILNVFSADTCDETTYLYTLTLTVTP